LSNSWALVQAGKLNLDVLLSMMLGLDSETDRFVIQKLIAILTSINDSVVDADSESDFRSFVSRRLRPQLDRLGFPPEKQKSESANEEVLLGRAAIIDAMARLAADPDVVRKADAYARKWLQDRSSIDLDTMTYLLPIASYDASSDRISALKSVLVHSTSAQDQTLALRALGSFRNPEILKQALSLVLSADIKSQDVFRIFRSALSDRTMRPVVYDFIRSSWPGLRERLPGPLIVETVDTLASTCDKTQRERLQDFFLKRSADIEGINQPMQEALDSAKLCEALHAQQKQSLIRFFAQSPKY
jgi:hypothetical protein